jgi:hypothetical protein
MMKNSYGVVLTGLERWRRAKTKKAIWKNSLVVVAFGLIYIFYLYFV